MSGPGFGHMQTFSRKENPGGQSVDQVIGEAAREPEYSLHVAHPNPPVILFAGGSSSLSELRARHDAMVEAGATVVRKADGTEGRRAIRKDRHTLLTHVSSYPVAWADIGDDPEALERLQAWKAREIAFLRKQYGDRLELVLEHDDETHPHIHAYILPHDIPGLNAAELHPGKVAKQRAEAEAKAAGQAPRDAVKAGNVAYKAAMRDWQDLYYMEVLRPSGLTRTGPRRARLTRQQWQQQKAEAELKAKELADLKQKTSAMLHSAMKLAGREDAVQGNEEALRREREALAAERQAFEQEKAELARQRQELQDREQLARDAQARAQLAEAAARRAAEGQQAELTARTAELAQREAEVEAQAAEAADLAVEAIVAVTEGRLTQNADGNWAGPEVSRFRVLGRAILPALARVKAVMDDLAQTRRSLRAGFAEVVWFLKHPRLAEDMRERGAQILKDNGQPVPKPREHLRNRPLPRSVLQGRAPSDDAPEPPDDRDDGPGR